jgi:phosphatidate cytidylyltransferase
MKRNREIVALILLPLLYLYIMELSPLYFFVLISIVSCVAQSEFYSMYRVKKIFHGTGIISGLILLYAFYNDSRDLVLFLILSFLFLVAVRLFRPGGEPANALNDIAPAVLGFLYIPVILGLQIPIRNIGPEWIIYTGGTVWASDSVAYYVGKNFGKKKLYPVMSPKKTVAGAYGSLLGGSLASLIVTIILIDALSLPQALLFGIAIGALTVVGDLSESMFKRDAKVKDSSFLIPGHGGILDKIDGMLCVTPFVYIVVRYVI